MRFDHFDLIAPLYHRSGKYTSEEMMQEACALPTGGMLLDVGGGTGRVASRLRGKAGGIVVVDASRGMLHYAASVPGLWTAAAHSERLPFADGTFERVIMVDALHHVIDQVRTAGELFRVLKPGGRIVIEEPNIQSFRVKLIAFAEKALLMRSHFLAAGDILRLFPKAIAVESKTADPTAWVIIQK